MSTSLIGNFLLAEAVKYITLSNCTLIGNSAALLSKSPIAVQLRDFADSLNIFNSTFKGISNSNEAGLMSVYGAGKVFI